MKKLIPFTAILAVIISLAPVRIAEAVEEKSFREDFSSERLSSVWGMGTFSLYNFKAEPDMVSNSSGINYLKLGSSKSKIYPSGLIYTKERFPYGLFSARIRVSDMPGAVASFFACSEITDVFTTGTHDEIDFELITAKPHSVLISTWRSAPEKLTHGVDHNSYLWENPSFDIRQWHVYRFDWHPDKVEFYIDDKKVWTSTKAIPRRDMQITLHIYTIDTWTDVQFPPKGEVLQMTDWVEYRKFK
ncbi:MAG: glycoside hydrolase family 16 protein [Nitrospirae bacterium]|nr:glycoside hydrolase family 16 protein [Nitrospirota bacterium]